MTNREQIIAAAQAAGFNVHLLFWSATIEAIEDFYAIAFEHGRSLEREAIAAKDAEIAELVAALEKAETYLVQRGIESRGVIGRTEVLPTIRNALAKVRKP